MPIVDTYFYLSTCNLKFETWTPLIFDRVALLFPQPFYSCTWGLALPCVAKTSRLQREPTKRTEGVNPECNGTHGQAWMNESANAPGLGTRLLWVRVVGVHRADHRAD